MRLICRGMEHAHEHGVIHRDLKPENVLVARTRAGVDVVKVVDFGVAELLDPLASGGSLAEEELEREIVGTPEFMAPEQIDAAPVPVLASPTAPLKRAADHGAAPGLPLLAQADVDAYERSLLRTRWRLIALALGMLLAAGAAGLTWASRLTRDAARPLTSEREP